MHQFLLDVFAGWWADPTVMRSGSTKYLFAIFMICGGKVAENIKV
jgi:hypothetical protein